MLYILLLVAFKLYQYNCVRINGIKKKICKFQPFSLAFIKSEQLEIHIIVVQENSNICLGHVISCVAKWKYSKTFLKTNVIQIY